MVLLKRILILEDNLHILSKLLSVLDGIEQDQPFDLSVVVLTDHELVQTYINDNPHAKFDIILLDRDCKLNGSFHILDIQRFGVEKVIAISTVTEYNAKLKAKGVTKIVEKDYRNIDKFAIEVGNYIKEMLQKMPLIEE